MTQSLAAACHKRFLVLFFRKERARLRLFHAVPAAPVLLSLLLAGAAPTPAHQQIEDAERIRAAELAAQGEADARLHAAQAEAARLAAQRVVAASRLRAAEAATAQANVQMESLEERRARAQKRLASRAADLQQMFPLIERLAVFPSETLLAIPATPKAALQGLMLLHGLSVQIERDAEAAHREQAQVAGLGRDIAAETARLAAARTAQMAQATALDQQITGAQQAARAAEDSSAEAARRAADQAARADNLRSAIVGLEQQRQTDEARAREDARLAEQDRHEAESAEAKRRQAALAAPAGPGISEPRRQLTSPVAGTVVHNYGDTTETGAATGITYRAPPGARVISPCGGKVVFAGPFRSFGLLLIVDCGGGYHFVLAGFDRLDVQVGRQVQAGEPVGVMPNWDMRASSDRPSLYMELRHDGAPVNPSPWLRAQG